MEKKWSSERKSKKIKYIFYIRKGNYIFFILNIKFIINRTCE